MNEFHLIFAVILPVMFILCLILTIVARHPAPLWVFIIIFIIIASIALSSTNILTMETHA